MFMDGTDIYWFPDGNVRLVTPPNLPQERKDKHINYIQETLAYREVLADAD